MDNNVHSQDQLKYLKSAIESSLKLGKEKKMEKNLVLMIMTIWFRREEDEQLYDGVVDGWRGARRRCPGRRPC